MVRNRGAKNCAEMEFRMSGKKRYFIIAGTGGFLLVFFIIFQGYIGWKEKSGATTTERTSVTSGNIEKNSMNDENGKAGYFGEENPIEQMVTKIEADYYGNDIVIENAKETDYKISGNKKNQYQFYLNSSIGYSARLTDKVMTLEGWQLSETEDGGNSWNELGYIPGNRTIISFSFISEDIGFFCEKWVEGQETNFYRTQDGGKNYEKIYLPQLPVNLKGNMEYPYREPEAPWEDNGSLYMFCGEDEDAGFCAGYGKALYKSEDTGITWSFTGKIINFRNLLSDDDETWGNVF